MSTGPHCNVCYAPSHNQHHLRPKASGGGRGENLADLCRRCHDFAHEQWGPGDSYRGPQEFRSFVQEMRLLLGFATDGGKL